MKIKIPEKFAQQPGFYTMRVAFNQGKSVDYRVIVKDKSKVCQEFITDSIESPKEQPPQVLWVTVTKKICPTHRPDGGNTYGQFDSIVFNLDNRHPPMAISLEILDHKGERQLVLNQKIDHLFRSISPNGPHCEPTCFYGEIDAQ